MPHFYNEHNIFLLIVEYDQQEAKKIKNLIVHNTDSIRIKWVQTLRDAFAAIKRYAFNEILLSLNLPDIKGEKALKELREKEPELPIVVITEKNKHRGLALLKEGANDFIYRDFIDESILLKTLFTTAERRIIETELNKYRKRLDYQNIEKRKTFSKSSDVITRITKNHRIIRNINSASAKAENLNSFADDICKIISELSDFSGIWIGRFNSDFSVLEIIGAAGTQKLEFTKFNLREDTPSKISYIDSIKKGEKLIFNDIADNPLKNPWLNKNNTFNYISYASFPIIIDNKIWGTINFYSPKRYFFTTKEVKLLDELSIDISFAFSSFIKKLKDEEKSLLGSINELKYKNLFEKNLAGVFRTKLNGDILEANDKFVDIMGYDSLEEMKKIKLTGFFADIEQRKSFVDNLKENKFIENVEHKLLRKDGKYIFVLKNASLLKDEITGETIIQSTVLDITENKTYLEELKKRENILTTIAESAENILMYDNWEESVESIIEKLGNATGVSRVYLFANSTDKRGNIFASQRFEWTAPGIEMQIDNPALQNMPMKKIGFGRWVNTLAKGDVIKGNIADFPETEHKLLKTQNIRSIIVLPVFVNNRWWGFIGFDSCGRERVWSKTEEEALRTIATLIGNAIQRSLLEKELKQREIKLIETSLLAGIGHFEYDIVSNKISFSEGIYNIFGYDLLSPESTFDEIMELIHPEDKKTASDIFRYVFFEGKPGELIFRIKLKNNKIKKIWAKWEPLKDAEGEVKFLTGILFDVTQKKETEDKLLKFSHAIEHSPVIFLITDNNERIEYVNKRFIEVTGYRSNEVIGKKPSFWSSGEHNKEFYSEMLDTIYSGKDWSGEIRNRKKNGELYWEWTTISPVINKNGDITHFISVSIDITEKKRMDERLLEAIKRAEESDNIKSEFLALISHEIRTPINAIKSYSRFIEDETKPELKKEMQFAFEGINDASTRIIRSIELIINAAEIISGSYEVHKEIIDLHSLIYDKFLEFKSIALRKGIDLNFISSLSKAEINVDLYSVQQILQHILENAVKFTDKGKIEINLFRDKREKLTVRVTDTGIGMDDKFLNKLFIPFSQEDSSLARKFEGMGLGGTLIKNYADINNAEIKISSKKDKGTIIEITFINQ